MPTVRRQWVLSCYQQLDFIRNAGGLRLSGTQIGISGILDEGCWHDGILVCVSKRLMMGFAVILRGDCCSLTWWLIDWSAVNKCSVMKFKDPWSREIQHHHDVHNYQLKAMHLITLSTITDIEYPLQIQKYSNLNSQYPSPATTLLPHVFLLTSPLHVHSFKHQPPSRHSHNLALCNQSINQSQSN